MGRWKALAATRGAAQDYPSSPHCDMKPSYCSMLAGKLKHLKPDITGDFLYDALNAFYASDDPNILKQKITEIVGLTVGMSAGQSD